MISNRFGAYNVFHTAPKEKFQGVKPVKQSGKVIGLFRPIQHHVKFCIKQMSHRAVGIVFGWRSWIWRSARAHARTHAHTHTSKT